MKPALRLLAAFLVPALLLALLLGRASAAQRSPAWWDPDGVGTGSDWHYRVPVALGSTSSVNSTAKVDIDFAALMTQLGISGTFDINSVRVVRPGGTVATVQEYNDTIYGGATDGTATRGEVRWIVEDGGAQTYFVYFDITQNGSKAANPQTPINGNFEQSTAGTVAPAGWNAPTRASLNFDAQVRPNETVSVTNDPVASNDGVTTRSTNGSPNTGSFAYLMGWRSATVPLENGAPGVVFSKTIAVPATNPGNLVFRWKPQGWDAEAFDNLTVSIAGSTTTTMIAGSLGNYATAPSAPNIGSSPSSNSSAGYRQYNGWDCDLNGTHHAGMTIACHSDRWFTYTQSLAAYAGQTVTLTFTETQDAADRSWFMIDDIEWSVVTGTAGNAEAFGVAATSPAGSLTPGQVVTVRAVVDAKPTAATSPVTADLINASGTTVASAVKLYNDGTHGDSTANDATWTNNGSDGANPTYTIPISSGSSSGWKVRIYAKDASSSTLGQAGMLHRSGQGTPLVLANWWNIDEASFNVDAAIIGVSKTMTVLADGLNSANFKAIPGAELRYCVTISNSGTASASSLVAADPLPAALSYIPGSIRSGADCSTAATAEDDDASGADESDPIGASFGSGTLNITRGSLPTSGSFAVTYRVNVL